MGIHLNGDKIATEKPTVKDEDKELKESVDTSLCQECSGKGLLDHGTKLCTKCAGSGTVR